VLSVHLSSQVSGTYESAQLAAREASIPVVPVDSRQVGVATGYAALSAADVVDAGGSAAEAAEAARERAARSHSLFYVDTLEYLRRGGRIGAAAAVLGSALAVKPLLTLREGRIAPLEKVRTTARALGRLEELAVAAAGDRPVDVAVAHLAGKDRAEALADRLRARLAANIDGRDVTVGEVGAVIGAHVGPGMVAVVVAPR
jgi:DegV family protein with EDD domain